jgi:UDP-N-acetylmuramate dehydrogenase
VGAGPMQNIGAYGVELKDVFYQLQALHIHTGEVHQFGLNDCQFDYRSSVFKTTLKGQYAILSVEFNLSKKHNLSLSYGSIEQELESMGVNHPTIQDVSQAVINIRKSKLPDPAQIGNAGSFFKNPSIDAELAEKLKEKYPDLPSYPSTEIGRKKIAAGWLIEKAGFKGKSYGNYGVHKNQALVLVNYGGAAGSEIFDLSEKIIQTIRTQFGIELEREVNII